MTDEEVDAYLAAARAHTNQKQGELIHAFGIGGFPRYWFDQTAGTLQFRNDREEPQVEALFTPIGSYAPKSSTWQWGWANHSLTDLLRERAGKLRMLATKLDMPAFDTPLLSAQ